MGVDILEVDILRVDILRVDILGGINPLQLLVSVVDLGGVRGVQMHLPLGASNVFLRA